MTSLSQRAAWQELIQAGKNSATIHLREFFAGDAARGRKFRLQAGPLTLDYSRERLRKEDMQRLVHLAEEAGIAGARDTLFSGAIVNMSERRPALHTALRQFEGTVAVNGADVLGDVSSERARALGFARALRAGARKNIKHIIHVGIGGSDLGPRLLAEAFSDGQGPAVHFVANVDPAPLHWLMLALEPKETLVLLVSKSFTTAEVKRNGETLKLWLANALGKKAGEHLVAVTAAPEAAKAFGIEAKNIYLLWDWVGGRFSIASSVSLSAMAAIGPQRFEEFLRGMAAMDAHFKTAPLDENMPVLLALLALWNINVLGLNSRAVLPYCEALSLWPSYLQQLEMESLGKSVDVDGAKVDYATAPVIFGSSGTPAQHAYMQALHQGTLQAATEILIVKEGEGIPEHHRMLQAHALAQAEALAFGKDKSEIHESDPALAAQKSFEGNRPSSLIILEKLSPEALGALVALYEHKVFVLGRLWNLNPFDQWGVELGKQLAGPFEAYLAGETDDPRAPESLKEIR